ncbi:hypothetical protein F4815DRAFT_501208, partial [Daldinia loculata]
MTGGKNPPRPRRFLSAKVRPQRKRPAPPTPEWIESARKRRASEEEDSEQPIPVKQKTEPVIPTPPVVPPVVPPVPELEPERRPKEEPEQRSKTGGGLQGWKWPSEGMTPNEESAVANPPVTPSETSSGQNQGMVIPEDVLWEVVKGVQGYGTPADPINRAEEQAQQDDSQLPPLADFLYRFGSGFTVVRNYVERGLCGVQSLVDSLTCQDILPPGVRVPSIQNLLDIYQQNVSRGSYDVSFTVTPEDRNMPGPFQAEILSHVISEWSRLHSSPPFRPYEESEASRLQRRVPPLVAGFYSEGERPFAMQITEPGTRIVWIHNSGNHWEGLRPGFSPVTINEIFRNYGHELFQNETAPQWFVEMVQRRQEPLQLLPRYRPWLKESRSADERLGLFGGTPSPPQVRILTATASQALEILERLYRARRERNGN